MTVLSLSFVLGMAVALACTVWWRVAPASAFHQRVQRRRADCLPAVHPVVCGRRRAGFGFGAGA